jgi:flavin reductase (DIM6/NTAB) family NADH-FMN oxidoreductase RutF
MKKTLKLDIAYRLVNPGPVVLVSSLFDGKPAITPIAWHMPFSDDPPIIALEIWKGHFIHKAVIKTGDFVINIPPAEMAGIVRKLGGVSGAKVDKFREFNLATEASKKITSPRLAGSIGILECKVRKDSALLKKYSVILGDVVHAEAEESAFTDRWCPENNGPRPISHLGGKVFALPERGVL